MSLEDLIAELKKHDPNKRVKLGFCCPHSYRGSYECLAFEPYEDASVGAMLTLATSALGQIFYGYKGGEYRMGPWSRVYLANLNESGEELGPTLLKYMLADEMEGE